MCGGEGWVTGAEYMDAVERIPCDCIGFYCDGCEQRIDPDVCGCGDSITHSAFAAGHAPVPMGCECFRDVSADDVRLTTGENNG